MCDKQTSVLMAYKVIIALLSILSSFRTSKHFLTQEILLWQPVSHHDVRSEATEIITFRLPFPEYALRYTTKNSGKNVDEMCWHRRYLGIRSESEHNKTVLGFISKVT